MKVGIITMHRVLNLGSALQAFALQRFLSANGIESEIIDYEFPPKRNLLYRINIGLRVAVYRLRAGTFFKKTTKSYFKDFYKNFFQLSRHKYPYSDIRETNDIYDVFLTGSDQVWNPVWTQDDTNFLLSFADDGKLKFSYAASFAINSIPDKYKNIYKNLLNRYKYISVRENSGVDIVKELTGKQADLVLDPTLLLAKEDYGALSRRSTVHFDEPFILVYILNYMYNPYPEINNIIKNVHNGLGGKVVYIGSGKFSAYSNDCICVDNLGPCEFVWLFEHASFIITTSFHGTAFASLFHKPLISVVKSKNDTDGRMPTLLKLIGGENSIIEYNAEDFHLDNPEYYRCSEERLSAQRELSRNTLLGYFKQNKSCQK